MRPLSVASSVVLALLTVAIRPATARHAICYWTGPRSDRPDHYGYTKFCSGKQHKIDDKHVAFECVGGIRVADLNYIGPGLLEMATPCADGGYGGEACKHSTYWAVCLEGEKGEHDCKFMYKGDDCSWSYGFEMSTLPYSVGIYYKADA